MNEEKNVINTKENEDEISDEVINHILEDKTRHMDIINLQGDYDKAVCHLQATQVYKKEYIENLKDIKFCDDCLNPIPDENYKEAKYEYCTDIRNLADLGTGVFLYFVYMRFICVVLILCFGVVGIINMYLNRSYFKEIRSICENKFYSLDNAYFTGNVTEICEKSMTNKKYKNITNSLGKLVLVEDVGKFDFLYQLNFENLSKFLLKNNTKK